MKNSDIINMAYAIGMSQEQKEVEQFVEFLTSKYKGHLNNFIEIGTKLGGMFYLLSNIISGKKISIDLVDGKFGGWILKQHPYLGDVYAKRDMFFKSQYQLSNSHMIQGNSHDPKIKTELVKILNADNKRDFASLLFIDGDHTYRGVKNDYLIYRDYVKKGGLIVFHDINDSEHHRKMNCEVHKFWNELKGEKYEFNIKSHWAGIGILVNNND